MKQKLIELIIESDEWADKKCDELKCEECPYYKKSYCTYGLSVDYLIANGVTIQKWIPVSERLPEECGFYICFYQSPYGNDCWRVGQCHWNEESWVRIGAVPPHVKVTH